MDRALGKTLHWKLKRSVSAPKCQCSPAGQSLIQPLLGPFEHNLGQNSSIRRLLQPTLAQKWDCILTTETALFLGRKQICLIYSDMLFLLHAVDFQIEPINCGWKLMMLSLIRAPFFSCLNNIALTIKRGRNYLGLFISVHVLHFSKIATTLL